MFGASGPVAADTYFEYGMGLRSCGAVIDYLEEAPSRREGGVVSWVTGFVSGAGWAGLDLRESDAYALVRSVMNECHKDPLISFSKAVQKTVMKLKK